MLTWHHPRASSLKMLGLSLWEGRLPGQKTIEKEDKGSHWFLQAGKSTECLSQSRTCMYVYGYGLLNFSFTSPEIWQKSPMWRLTSKLLTTVHSEGSIGAQHGDRASTRCRAAPEAYASRISCFTRSISHDGAQREWGPLAHWAIRGVRGAPMRGCRWWPLVVRRRPSLGRRQAQARPCSRAVRPSLGRAAAQCVERPRAVTAPVTRVQSLSLRSWSRFGRLGRPQRPARCHCERARGGPS